MKQHFQFLKDAYFFKSLSDEDIHKIQKVCGEEHFDAGEVVFYEGTTGDRCFIILKGSVEIWKDYNSTERDLLSIYQSGQLFGELALIDDSPRGATIVAREPVNLISIKRDDFNQVIKGSSTISISIMKAITATIREQTDHFLDNLRTSKRRLAKAYSQLRKEVEERKQLESQLLQAQKMESIGTLAGGIAHDFRNILFLISGYTQLTLEKIPENTEYRDNLMEILGAVERARDLIKQILTFSRQSNQERRPTQIQLIIKEVIKMLKSSLPASIQIIENINNNCGTVMADPTQIHQIIMNLSTNAYHAMKEKGGDLEISLDEIRAPSDDAAHFPPDMPPGFYVRLTVRDTGCGMDRDTVDKVFDPYFTTKKAGEGTGLGLSIVHGIVKSHGGHIHVFSEPGKGSVFYIYLPLFVSNTTLPEKAYEAPAPGGNERILIVEEEEKIAQMLMQMLSPLGYQVKYRINSVEALRALQAQPENFDLVITDLNMPNMTGDELAKAIKHIRPDIPILLCTGFSEIITKEKMKAVGISEIVKKPAIKNELARVIRNVLDAPLDEESRS